MLLIPRHEIANSRLGSDVKEDLPNAQYKCREHQRCQVYRRSQDQYHESNQDGETPYVRPHHHPSTVQSVHYDTSVQ